MLIKPCIEELSDAEEEEIRRLQNRIIPELRLRSLSNPTCTCADDSMSEGDSKQDPIENLSPEEANRIIHSHRKVRYGKWPSCPYTTLPYFHGLTNTQEPHAGRVAKGKVRDGKAQSLLFRTVIYIGFRRQSFTIKPYPATLSNLRS
jgi:hypothetical protein